MKTYYGIFFTWCVPGVVLVLWGRASGQMVLAHFGMVLLSVGLFYYGRVKRHRVAWAVAWLALAVMYLGLGLVELWRGWSGGRT